MVGSFAQICTYWSPLAKNKFGETSFNAPVSLTVRWENRTQIIKDSFGQDIVSHSTIYMPSQNVALNGYLFFGTSTEANPMLVYGAYKILSINTSYSVDGTDILTKVMI